ncbi:MAG: hypothetical protein B6D62_00490 [Candidatus Cloacimonas sp. 4484_275]|nr:MAG: hypothetical protein B6D62_00490 [Candidatus Cloacimonas sp. 4484_275]
MKKNLSLKILALVVAILLWLQQSLLKEHTAEISFPLKFENVPKNYVILANNLSDIPVLVKSRGMNIIFLKKSNCFFRINAANFHFGENKINLGKDDLIFSSKKKIEIIEIKKKSFKIYLDKIITKSVPIKIVFATSKDEEFFLKNKIVNINQNVKIKGPATILSKVKRVKTTAISRKMLKNVSRFKGATFKKENHAKCHSIANHFQNDFFDSRSLFAQRKHLDYSSKSVGNGSRT